MKIDELREAFAAWPPPKGEIDVAFQILRLLRDPTPITEAGLRELGFIEDSCGIFRTPSRLPCVEKLREDDWNITTWTGNQRVKSMGNLRLLLSVGE